MNSWSTRINEFRKVSLNPAFIDSRAIAEESAKDLLNRMCGRFTEHGLIRFLDLINTEKVPPNLYTNGLRAHDTRTRFQLSFIGKNRNDIIESIGEFNRWIPALWQSTDDTHDALDQFWEKSMVKGAGIGLPTMIMYLKDPLKYNVWLPFLAKALETLIDRTFYRAMSATNYMIFNEAVNEYLRRPFGLKPQEIDYVLYRIGRS